MISHQARFQAAIDGFDAANREDPNLRVFQGQSFPQQLLYGRQMTQWLQRLEPDATETLQLAARSQHLCRWMIPRSGYPMDRAGYHHWRTRLYEFHAEKAGDILAAVGYDTATIARVQGLLRKKNLKSDPQMQTLEDVACLVFLENDFVGLAGKHDAAKMIDIIRKTWKKMSPRGQRAALEISMADSERALLQQALAPLPPADHTADPSPA
jgi:hypothetical protein